MRKLHAYVDGERNAFAESLSPAMWRMIGDVRYNGDPFNSCSDGHERAAAKRTLEVLRQRGLMRGNELTAVGRKMIERIEWREPDEL